MNTRCLCCNSFVTRDFRCPRFASHLWEVKRVVKGRWAHNGSVTKNGQPRHNGWHYYYDEFLFLTRKDGDNIAHLLSMMLNSLEWIHNLGRSGDEFPITITQRVCGLRRAV